MPPPLGEKPRFLSTALTGDAPRYFFQTERRRVRIEDVRSWEVPPQLERQGFELLSASTSLADLTRDEAMPSYRAETEALVADALGATRVVAFDVTRRSDAPAGASNPDGARRPAARIHVDYTAASGPKRARDVLGEDFVDSALAAGAAIVQLNVWRPIEGPVLRAPLALGDASSLQSRDLVATEQVFPDRVGEIYHLAHRAEQRFAFASRMLRDEVLLLKGWDSRSDGRARLTPHSSFALPNEADAPPRQSIEVRTFAVLPA